MVSNSRFHNKCRVCRQSTGVNSNCCKLCKSVGDLSCSKNVFAKGNRALLEIIMVVTGLDDSFVIFRDICIFAVCFQLVSEAHFTL